MYTQNKIQTQIWFTNPTPSVTWCPLPPISSFHFSVPQVQCFSHIHFLFIFQQTVGSYIRTFAHVFLSAQDTIYLDTTWLGHSFHSDLSINITLFHTLNVLATQLIFLTSLYFNSLHISEHYLVLFAIYVCLLFMKD
jgi:hypothetical protein